MTNMENDKQLKNEIEKFWGDIKAMEEQLSYERQNYAKILKDGMGKNMVEYINNPPKPNRWKGIKLKLKRWWNYHIK